MKGKADLFLLIFTLIFTCSLFAERVAHNPIMGTSTSGQISSIMRMEYSFSCQNVSSKAQTVKFTLTNQSSSVKLMSSTQVPIDLTNYPFKSYSKVGPKELVWDLNSIGDVSSVFYTLNGLSEVGSSLKVKFIMDCKAFREGYFCEKEVTDTGRTPVNPENKMETYSYAVPFYQGKGQVNKLGYVDLGIFRKFHRSMDKDYIQSLTASYVVGSTIEVKESIGALSCSVSASFSPQEAGYFAVDSAQHLVNGGMPF